MTTSYKLLIGADNRTKRLHKKTAIKIVSRVFEAFTVYETEGYWRGTSEKSMVIEIIVDGRKRRSVERLAKELAKELKQEAIGLDSIPSRIKFIK